MVARYRHCTEREDLALVALLVCRPPHLDAFAPRLLRVTKVGQNWYRQDKESVEAWLPQSELPEDTRKAIQNPPTQNWWQRLTNR